MSFKRGVVLDIPYIDWNGISIYRGHTFERFTYKYICVIVILLQLSVFSGIALVESVQDE